MALWGQIGVNSRTIGAWSVQRLDPMAPDDDTVCRYRYLISFDGESQDRTGEVTHRFGDGALTLMRKVFEHADPT